MRVNYGIGAVGSMKQKTFNRNIVRNYEIRLLVKENFKLSIMRDESDKIRPE